MSRYECRGGGNCFYTTSINALQKKVAELEAENKMLKHLANAEAMAAVRTEQPDTDDLIYDAYELGQEDAESNAIHGYGSEPYKDKAQVLAALKESE